MTITYCARLIDNSRHPITDDLSYFSFAPFPNLSFLEWCEVCPWDFHPEVLVDLASLVAVIVFRFCL